MKRWNGAAWSKLLQAAGAVVVWLLIVAIILLGYFGGFWRKI